MDPEDLTTVMGEAVTEGGIRLSPLRRRSLAAKALRATAAIDRRMALALEPEEGVLDGGSGAKVLVIGSGGREHAMALKLTSSPHVSHVYVAPGNGGTAAGRYPGVSNVAADEIPSILDKDALVKFARSNGVSLVAVGPEAPLVEGVVDALTEAGIPCFGPSAAAARLEASKAFSKDFMRRHQIPTARFSTFTDVEKAKEYVTAADHRVVVKASGLAAGKGVLIPDSRVEAIRALETVMVEKAFGDSGNEVVVEEYLEGEEASDDTRAQRVLGRAYVVADCMRYVNLNRGGEVGCISGAPDHDCCTRLVSFSFALLLFSLIGVFW